VNSDFLQAFLNPMFLSIWAGIGLVAGSILGVFVGVLLRVPGANVNILVTALLAIGRTIIVFLLLRLVLR